MDSVREYVQAMKFKKRMTGGVDEENVLKHIKKICDLAREELEEQNKAFETTTQKMQKDLDGLRSQLEQSRADCRQLREINGKMDAQIRELQLEAKHYEEARQQAEQSQQTYAAKRKELMVAVEALQGLRSEAIQVVREEMGAALEEEKEEARSRMLSELERERTAARRELDLLASEFAALRQQKQEVESSLRRERERLQQHLDWLASRSTPAAATVSAPESTSVSAPVSVPKPVTVSASKSASEGVNPSGSFGSLNVPEIVPVSALNDSPAVVEGDSMNPALEDGDAALRRWKA